MQNKKKKKQTNLIDISMPNDHNVQTKYNEKITIHRSCCGDAENTETIIALIHLASIQIHTKICSSENAIL